MFRFQCFRPASRGSLPAVSPALSITSAVLLLLAHPGGSATATEPVRDLIEAYQADADLLSRHWAISGDSEAELAREPKLLQDWQQRLTEVDFNALSENDRVDFILLRNEFESSLSHLARREQERKELAPWLPFRGVIDTLADARVRGEPLVAEKAAGMLAPVADRVTKLQEQLKAAKEEAAKQQPRKQSSATSKNIPKPANGAQPSAPKPKPAPPSGTPPMTTPSKDKNQAGQIKLPTAYQALRCAEVVDELRESLKRWFENYNGFVPEFGWWVDQPHDQLAKGLENYGKFLREEVAGIKGKDEDPLLGRAIGADLLKRQLGFEFIPYSPEELIAIAEREFAWCEARMKETAKEMKLGDDWKKALARTKAQFVKPGEQEALVREEGREAIAFVKSHELVGVPPDCEEWWGTRMLSPKEQKQIPYAAYSGHDMLVAYASEDMKHEDKLMSMRGNSRPFMHNVVPHELIPGHHLQNFMAARHRPYRRMFSTPFFVEGWALYWEMRLWDLGYHKTPEEKIGALFWRMHRCARIIVTLKFHLGQMKPDEMVKFLTDRVGHEKFGATSEVRRFIKGDYSPLYQCGYMLGGMQLRALHQELTTDGKMSEQQFHDAVLELGPVPVELIRATMKDLPLNATYTAQWRFDDRP